MILESLIQNEQRVTFDCCKKTIFKGGVLEIPDAFYSHPEITGAIRQGLVRIIGPEPVVAQPTAIIKKTRLRNKTPHLLTFECVKGSVPTGQCIEIPDNLIQEREIQNALAWNMLEDVNNPKPIAIVGAPVELDEITVNDVELATQVIPTTSTPQRQSVQPPPSVNAAPATRRPRRTNSARPIKRAADEGEGLYAESQVRDVRATRRTPAGSSAPIEIDVNSSGPAQAPEISFDDIFEGQ